MHISEAVSLLGLAGASRAALSNKPCPLYGQNYPAPADLVSSLHIQSASNSVRSQIAAAQNKTSPLSDLLDTEATVFSLDFFSLNEEDTTFSLHYTPETYVTEHTSGALAVNSETIYRLGSVSKLWTAYLWLIAAGDASWNEPVTKYVPELEAIVATQATSATDDVDWKSITIGALASHTAGIGRDAAYSAELATMLESLGIPNQGGNSHSTCGSPSLSMIPCNRTQFFTDFPVQHPVFAPFQTPAYSNAAYQILAYALENITNQSLETLFNIHLVGALNLSSTSYGVPATTADSVIPYNATASWWSADLLGDAAAGGYFSTINDVRKVGRAMLGSAQLDEATTRRWMKPTAFVSGVPPDAAAVGAPWEIYRAPGRPHETMLTKSGDLGLYSANVVLVPEWQVGFTVLAAGDAASTNVRVLSDVLTEAFVPAVRAAVRAAAREEARVAYAGTFVDDATRSNITLVVEEEEDKPGLAVTEWTYGGRDVLALMGLVNGENTTARLYPSGLTSKMANGTVTSAWRAVYEVLPVETDGGVFANGCYSWYTMANMIYGGVGLDEFLFRVQAGKAKSLEPRALGVAMTRHTQVGK